MELIIMDKMFIHKEHKAWMEQLNFYQDEIKFFQNELFNVLQENPNNFSLLDYVKEYRNIFIKKLEHLDEIRYQISEHEAKLKVSDEEDQNSKNHNEIRDNLNSFVEDFELLKKNFRRFASHND